MKLSDDLKWRGLIKDKTFDDPAWLDKPRVFYHGYDASTDSLTVGNLAALLLDWRLIDAGWQAVILMGGGTSLVGDPGGKTAERELKSPAEIAANIAAIREQVNRLFKGAKFTMVDNSQWLAGLNVLDFLRDTGKHFSMSELMQREFVTARIGEGAGGISYAEFSYSLIQGYDYWHLFKQHKTELQVGGSDQWANMLTGVSLVRKKEGAEVQALSMPLVINKATGVKFGKSEGGAVWLDPAKTTPTQFYQFWVNTDDADVEDYLKVFTLLSREHIEDLMARQAADPAARVAQLALAKEVTELVHGKDSGGSSAKVTKYLTSKVSLLEASSADLEEIRQQIPSIQAKAGDPVVDILVAAGLADSKSEARRLLAGKAIYVNGEPVDSELLPAAAIEGGRALIRRGKAYKDSALIELE